MAALSSRSAPGRNRRIPAATERCRVGYATCHTFSRALASVQRAYQTGGHGESKTPTKSRCVVSLGSRQEPPHPGRCQQKNCSGVEKVMRPVTRFLERWPPPPQRSNKTDPSPEKQCNETAMARSCRSAPGRNRRIPVAVSGTQQRRREGYATCHTFSRALADAKHWQSLLCGACWSPPCRPV